MKMSRTIGNNYYSIGPSHKKWMDAIAKMTKEQQSNTATMMMMILYNIRIELN